ncbi:MAG: hypothetical protein ACYDEX_13760 [Mobilitalea sp.]
MKYQNFNASVYCPVGDLLAITDFEAFDQKFKLIENNIKVGKVYLETFRGGTSISKEQMLKVKEYFEKKGIATAGGITPVDYDKNKEGGFHSFCYTSPATRDLFKRIVTLTSELFDEFILDDFYFTNCRCEHCIEAKGNRSWSEFRLALMQEVSENIFIKVAKEVNPDIKTIIKYPNWYEHYQETGYNLEEEPKVFDYIYAGTETRNPAYSQQHLPKYLSYFIMRYLENVAPNRNLGGWFDSYECTYNLTSYLDQGYLTLFGKAKEAMLFCLGSLIRDKSYTTFPPAIGQVFEDVDQYLNKLGNPIGVSCYLPYHNNGEDYLHNYVGMCGIPLEPYPDYPDAAKTVFLTENAASDIDIIAKMQKSLKAGSDIIVTSGFVAKTGQAFKEFMNISYTSKKAMVNHYMYSTDGGLSISGSVESATTIMLPQLEYSTNDVWELLGGYGEENNFPILLKSSYAGGRVFVLTIPDDPGNLYHYPPVVLNTLRSVLCKELPVTIDGDSKIALFTYDNDTFILRSFLPFADRVVVTVKYENAILTDIENDKTYNGITTKNETKFNLYLTPGVNHVLKINKMS